MDQWKIQYTKLVESYPLDNADKQNNMLNTMLEGEAYDIYTTKLSEGQLPRTEEQKLQKLATALNAVALNVFNSNLSAWRHQRNYMSHKFVNLRKAT